MFVATRDMRDLRASIPARARAGDARGRGRAWPIIIHPFIHESAREPDDEIDPGLPASVRSAASVHTVGEPGLRHRCRLWHGWHLHQTREARPRCVLWRFTQRAARRPAAEQAAPDIAPDVPLQPVTGQQRENAKAWLGDPDQMIKEDCRARKSAVLVW